MNNYCQLDFSGIRISVFGYIKDSNLKLMNEEIKFLERQSR